MSQPIPPKPAPQPYPPYVALPDIRKKELPAIPCLKLFQALGSSEFVVKAYRIRVKWPKFPWGLFFFCLFLTLIGEAVSLGASQHILDDPGPAGSLKPVLIISGYFLSPPSTCRCLFFHYFRPRGHTLLYVTNRRVIVVELLEGTRDVSQAVLSFKLSNISGFTLFLAQHGLKKLLSLILLSENELSTFIVTKNFARFRLAALSSRRSLFQPGTDAVSLCTELDSLVLAIQSGQVSAVTSKPSI